MSAICITLGEQNENHVGMQIQGKGLAERGYSTTFLRSLPGEYTDLSLGEIDAGVLLIRNYLNKKDSDSLFRELTSLKWDTTYFDTRRQKVLNKRARYNLCFGSKSISPQIDKGIGTIVGYTKTPLLNLWKKSVEELVEEENLECEGNYYYDIRKCGIGWHGDSERKKVMVYR